MKNEDICALCGTLLEEETLPEKIDREAEFRQNFPKTAKSSLKIQIICDDCYKKIQAWRKKNNLDEFGNPKV